MIEIRIYCIDNFAGHEFLPVVKEDGREVYRGEYQKTEYIALEKAKAAIKKSGHDIFMPLTVGEQFALKEPL